LSERFEVEYEDRDGGRHRIDIKGVPLAREAPVPGEPLSLEIDDQLRFAILTIRRFTDNSAKAFGDFMREAFSDLRRSRIDRLMIDLRGNTGGYPPHAADLLRYLIRHPVSYFRGEPRAGSEFAELYRPLVPRGDSFKGSVAVLIDGANISTASQLVSLVRFYKIALLAGEETGGTFWANANGRTVTLPNAKLEVIVAQQVFRTAVEGISPEKGIEPDINVQIDPGAETIAASDTDDVVTAVLRAWNL
jgi:C-terminal processing protease CtpA/Prc